MPDNDFFLQVTKSLNIPSPEERKHRFKIQQAIAGPEFEAEPVTEKVNIYSSVEVFKQHKKCLRSSNCDCSYKIELPYIHATGNFTVTQANKQGSLKQWLFPVVPEYIYTIELQVNGKTHSIKTGDVFKIRGKDIEPYFAVTKTEKCLRRNNQLDTKVWVKTIISTEQKLNRISLLARTIEIL